MTFLFAAVCVQDALYGSDDDCQKAETHDVEVVAPVMGATKKDGFCLSDFQINDNGLVPACPPGHAPAKVKQGRRCSVGFDAAICNFLRGHQRSVKQKLNPNVTKI